MITNEDTKEVSSINYLKEGSQSYDYLNGSVSLGTRLAAPVISHCHITNAWYYVYHYDVFSCLSFRISRLHGIV